MRRVGFQPHDGRIFDALTGRGGVLVAIQSIPARQTRSRYCTLMGAGMPPSAPGLAGFEAGANQAHP
jgi:hypothetical protein